MKINFITNTGAGFSGEVEVPDGITLEQFVRSKVENPDNYTVAVNRRVVNFSGEGVSVQDQSLPVAGGTILNTDDRVSIVSRSSVLREGQTVSVTPKNLPGAVRDFVKKLFGF